MLHLSSKSLARGLFAAAAVSAIAQGSLQAQANTHPVTGSVVDPRGNMVPKVTIAIKNEAGKDLTRTTTDGQGHFQTAPLGPGRYTVEATGTGFGVKTFPLVLGSDPAPELTVSLSLGGATEEVTVEAANSGSLAAQYAPMDALLDATSARTEITQQYISNFISPVADYSEIVQNAPGIVSVNSNGVGMGDGKIFFRGFKDGQYDITFDGIPFNDTNDPSHHSWAFFPGQWIGGVDFDRSPGSASTIGPAPYGGSINLLSREMSPEMNIRGGVSYGSFNTILADGQLDSGNFGPGKKQNVLVDIHRLTSDGFQTYNAQQRIGGSLKYVLNISPKTSLTGFAGVLMLDTNTPDAKNPTRLSALGNGTTFPGQYNFLLNNDPTSYLYYGYNNYHVPTDFEYIGYKSELGKGWNIDARPYTYSYNNRQNIATAPSTGGGVISTANCAPVVTSVSIPTGGTTKVAISPCGIDKLNSYRKYGTITQASQVSHFGIFRTGLWYEWAATDRYQTPYSPLTHAHDALPNFHEQFWTNSYEPFAEYEYHATSKWSITGGFKFAFFTQDLKQYADNGKTVGLLNGAAYTRNYAKYTSPLPAASTNYRIKQNWSAYFQYASGSVIPPSSVYDVTVGNTNPVSTLPKPTTAHTYQTGSVIKLKHLTLDGDFYYTRFQNTYITDPNTTSTTGINYQAGGDELSRGFEGEANIYLAKGVSFFSNGTVGSARYISPTLLGAGGASVLNPNYQALVAGTAANTESFGMTYQQKYLDIGIFNKRVGPQANDVSAASSGIVYQGVLLKPKTLNGIIPIDPFNITNLYFNYTVRNGGHLDNTKFRLSFNNLFDTRNITGVTQAAKANTYTPGGADTLSLTPGRSVTLTVTFGYSPKR